MRAVQPSLAPAPACARHKAVSLDALNFLLADVRGALGPYLNVFLVTQQHWNQAAVGLVTTVGGLLGLAVQTPIGGLIDATRAKRALVVAALAALALGAVTIFAAPYFWPVMIANSMMSAVGDVFGPAVAALTLGLYPRSVLARRMGRNSAWDHAGNVAIAAAAGAVGWAVSQRAVFLLVPFFAVLASLAVLSIPAAAIDHVRARGGEKENDGKPQPSGFGVLPGLSHMALALERGRCGGGDIAGVSVFDPALRPPYGRIRRLLCRNRGPTTEQCPPRST